MRHWSNLWLNKYCRYIHKQSFTVKNYVHVLLVFSISLWYFWNNPFVLSFSPWRAPDVYQETTQRRYCCPTHSLQRSYHVFFPQLSMYLACCPVRSLDPFCRTYAHVLISIPNGKLNWQNSLFKMKRINWVLECFFFVKTYVDSRI